MCDYYRENPVPIGASNILFYKEANIHGMFHRTNNLRTLIQSTLKCN
jgi:hypothetical protein